MLQSLAELQQRREATAQRIAQLGDFRPGSITNTSGRCGKASCHCLQAGQPGDGPTCHAHKAGHPGNGPNLRLTYKADGKTISESFPSPAAIHKAEREVAEFRKFQELSREFVETNAEILSLAAGRGGAADRPGKKTVEA